MFHPLPQDDKENQENMPPRARKFGMSSRRETYTSDDDSRDSGICDMDCSDMPTSFAPIPPRKASLQMSVLDEEMDDLVLGETRLSSQEKLTLQMVQNRPRAFTDITNSPRVESPKSRTSFRGFARPFARTQSYFGRKRILQRDGNGGKRSRAESIDENSEIPSQLPPLPPPAPLSIPIHRTHSTSVLERGSYAHHDEEVPKMLEVSYHLPTVSTMDSQAFRRIAASTLTRLVSDLGQEAFDQKYLLVDCRYPYEFNGGHIKNAINLFDPERCAEVFFSGGLRSTRRIPIFYCEYSQKRGPSMAYALRGLDRRRNELQYPRVDYEEIYVLDKGYRGFYENTVSTEHQSLCVPLHYVPMDDTRFSHILRSFSFHKRGVGSSTCVKPAEPRSRLLLRQMSADSPLSRPPTRRPLFSVPEASTGTPEKPAPLPQPRFS